jgi:N-acetylglucosamine-6-phosphate deacetylase
VLIAPSLLWSEGALHEGTALETAAGNVTHLRPLGRDTPDATPHLVMPGCTDLQVNGGGGVMLNGDATPDGLARIVAAHRRLGTSELLATVITDHPDRTEAAAEAVLAAQGLDGLLGIHIEGPHIAPARRGTHDAAHIRPLDRRTVALVARLRAAGVAVMLTLAPEQADPALMAELVQSGAVLSIGHSEATRDQTRAALANGVSCFTHLYNAMPPMASRDPGLLATAILSDAFCGLIADGIHVHWDMIRLALAARPRPDRTFLVSDAMATVGGPDHFELYGQRIAVRDGALVNAEGSLAGAHIDMVTSLANLHRHVQVPLDRAIAMATDIPRAAMGLAPVRVASAPLSRLIALTPDLVLDPTWEATA